MKTREGFVSNSSTSSFVMIGYKIDDIEEVLKLIMSPDEFEKEKEECKADSDDDKYSYRSALSDVLYVHSNKPELELDVLTDDGCYYVGKVVSNDDCGGMTPATLNGNDIENWMDGVQKLTKSEDKPGLIVGSRCC